MGIFLISLILFGGEKHRQETVAQQAEDDARIDILRLEDFQAGGNGLLADGDDEADKQALPETGNRLQEMTKDSGEWEENTQSPESSVQKTNIFTPHEKQVEVTPEDYSSYEELVKTFYTIDGGTMAGSDLLDVKKLTAYPCAVQKVDEPQILIFHTHTNEAFADSVPGDESTTILGVGELLAKYLSETYGYNVVHCKEAFDANGRDDAYGNALPVISQILEAYPSIEIVIDLHRDEMPEGTRLVTEVDGIPMAKFMFFNGLSRTRQTGNISYLQNNNLDENLSFSFQMQEKAMEYYPGLARKIYLKGYRYNMHLKEKYLLIELGAQNNTVEEVRNTCGPIAHILDLVLTGQ